MRLLVVEDDRALATALADGLRSEGHAVDVAHDGAEGLWFAEENDYHVVVLDLMLPQVNGVEVCRRLRAREDWTPVLMLTARDADGDMVSGLDAGADDYVTKPFSFEVVLARLRSLARRHSPERPPLLSLADLSLDPASRRVSRSDVDLTLSSREFAVLEVLLRNRGAVLNRQQLLGAVWGFDFDGDPNIVDVYVGRLRRKVDAPFDRALIETVRGSGYTLREPR